MTVEPCEASLRMDEMNVSQLLAEMTAEEPVMAATIPIETHIPFTKCPTNISCYRPNHYTKDYQY